MNKQSHNPENQLKDAFSLHQAGKIADAEKMYIKLLQDDPHHPDANQLLGLIYREKGQLDEAISHIQAAIDINPDIPSNYFNLGIALQESGNIEKATEAYGQCVQRQPDFAEAWDNLGTIFQQNDMYEESANAHMNAVQANPKLVGAWNNLGEAMRKQGLLNEALQAYEEGLLIEPTNASILSNMGNILRNRGEFDTAMQLYDRALSTEKLDIAVAGRLDGKWVDTYKAAIDSNYAYADPHWNKALALLQQGKLQEGWREYEWRFSAGKANITPYPFPVWQGEDLSDKTILILAEQGIGDEIMFISCLPDVCNLAKNIIVECDKRLLPLFERSFPGVSFISRDINNRKETLSADYQLAAGSLPGFFRKSLTDFPGKNSYLETDPEIVNEWKNRFDSLGEGIKVGISWRGGNNKETLTQRSIDLDKWKNILSIETAKFINLQYGDIQDELQTLAGSGLEIHDWPDSDPLQDMDDFAAKIAALDLVISVDNTTVHVAGSVNTPCWALIPVQADWRWLSNSTTSSHWYSSVSLLRQTETGKWEMTLEQVENKLKKHTQTNDDYSPETVNFKLDWGLHTILKLLQDYEFSSVLDIGSGAGEHKRFFEHFGKSVYANDIAFDSDYVGDFMELELDRQFDAIWCSHVLEHQRNVGAFLDKIYDSLNDGGVLAITVPTHARETLIAGHLTSWSIPLLVYNLVMAGFDCRKASILHSYELGLVVKKKQAIHKELRRPSAHGSYIDEAGDIFADVRQYFPFDIQQGITIQGAELNWGDFGNYSLPNPVKSARINISSKNFEAFPQFAPAVTLKSS